MAQVIQEMAQVGQEVAQVGQRDAQAKQESTAGNTGKHRRQNRKPRQVTQ